jgi:hypothetical protein
MSTQRERPTQLYTYVRAQVNASGEYIGPVTTEKFKEPMQEVTSVDTLNEKQRALAVLSPAERSMHLWRKLNPGVMASTINLPASTNSDTYHDQGRNLSPVVNKTVHRKKTDFNEYVNKKAQLGM